jgi:repressor LexA
VLLREDRAACRDAGIMDGDLLAVQKAKEAKNGQIVVARLHDDVTVKRFKRTRAGIELIPENPEFKTILVTPGDAEAGFAIEGLAVGLIRNNMLM